MDLVSESISSRVKPSARMLKAFPATSQHGALLREMTKATKEVGASNTVPSEIFGWFVLNQFIRLDPSDAATVKAQASSYKLEDVMASLQKTLRGESLADKDQERKRRPGAVKAYMAAPESNGMDSAVWASQEPEDDEDQDLEEVFDESLKAYMEDRENEEAPNEIINSGFTRNMKAGPLKYAIIPFLC